MKHLFFIIIFIILIAVPDISAQRYLPGQQGVQVIAGSVNGLNPGEGFHGGIAFSKYAKNTNRWVLGIEYLEKAYKYKDIKIPQSQFTLDAGYYLKFFSEHSKTFFLSLGASGIAGYESINWDKKLLFDGATIRNKDSYLYGGAVTLEAEIFLSDRLILLANVRERLLLGSSVGKFNTVFGLGLKIIIN